MSLSKNKILDIPEQMILKESWSEKESGFWNLWKPRWIVLKQKTLTKSAMLYVFKNEKKYINPFVSIPLDKNNCKLQEICKKDKQAFKLVITNGKSVSKYRFRIKNNVLRQEWKNVICDILYSVSKSVTSVKQGKSNETFDLIHNDIKVDNNNTNNIIVSKETPKSIDLDKLYTKNLDINGKEITNLLKKDYGYNKNFIDKSMKKYTKLYGKIYNMDIIIDFLEMEVKNLNINNNINKNTVNNINDNDDKKDELNKNELIKFVNNNKTIDFQKIIIEQALNIMDFNLQRKNNKTIMDYYNELKKVNNNNKQLIEILTDHALKILTEHNKSNNNLNNNIVTSDNIDDNKNDTNNDSDHNNIQHFISPVFSKSNYPQKKSDDFKDIVMDSTNDTDKTDEKIENDKNNDNKKNDDKDLDILAFFGDNIDNTCNNTGNIGDNKNDTNNDSNHKNIQHFIPPVFSKSNNPQKKNDNFKDIVMYSANDTDKTDEKIKNNDKKNDDKDLDILSLFDSIDNTCNNTGNKTDNKTGNNNNDMDNGNENFKTKKLIDWNENDIKNWLKTLPRGLSSKFKNIVDKYRMNGTKLMHLKESEFNQILPNKILQRKFKNELQKYGFKLLNTNNKKKSLNKPKKKKNNWKNKTISQWNKKDVSKWIDSLPKQLKKVKQSIVNDYRMDGKKLIKTCKNDDLWPMVITNPILRKTLKKRILKLKNEEDNQKNNDSQSKSIDDTYDNSDNTDLENKLKNMNDKDAVKALLKAKYSTKTDDGSFMFNIDTGKNVKFSHPCNRDTTILEIKNILYESNFGDKISNIELKYNNKTLKNNQSLNDINITNNKHLIKAYFTVNGAKK